MSAAYRLPPLDAETHAALVRWHDHTEEPAERTRCQMVLLASEQGWTAPQIAPVVRRSRDTVLRVLQGVAAAGLAAIPRRYAATGRPTATAAWQAELARVIDLEPRTVGVPSANWTTGLLAAYLAQTTGCAVGEETVRSHLHGLGYVCKRPVWTLAHTASERQDWVGNACGWSCS